MSGSVSATQSTPDPATQLTPEQKTVVGLRADMTISGEKVDIEGVIGEELFVQLGQEASLGTPIGFAYWLKETYAVDGEGIDLLTFKEYESGSDFQADYAAAYKN